MLECFGYFFIVFVVLGLFGIEPKEQHPNIYEDERIVLQEGQKVRIDLETGDVIEIKEPETEDVLMQERGIE